MGTISLIEIMKPLVCTAKSFLSALCLVFIVTGCSSLSLRPLESAPVVDPDATAETKALFLKLFLISSRNTMFGHQDDLAYGVRWRNVPGRSDVREAGGSYPAVYGWDVGHLERGGINNLDGVNFDNMRQWIMEGYRRGGVITISWHMDNPVTGDWFYDSTTPAVSEILPGGTRHMQYRGWLDEFADFALSLTVSGTAWNPAAHLVPVIFRPFHEHNHCAFWWGRCVTSEAEYIALWRFTVEYLKDVRGVHNLLYAFSTDARGMTRDNPDGTFNTPSGSRTRSFKEQYFYAYPGDEYVDVFGLDNYVDTGTSRKAAFKQMLTLLIETARERDDIKLPALTETGVDGVPNPNWWTEILLHAVNTGGRPRVAWALVWRNAARDHFFGPYLGHPSAIDFRRFRDSPMILFEDDLPYSLYTWPPE